jgi:hypothetical protein
MGFIIHIKFTQPLSCTSLAAKRKPNYFLMPAKLHPQVMATEAGASHAQHQQMRNAHPNTQL